MSGGVQHLTFLPIKTKRFCCICVEAAIKSEESYRRNLREGLTHCILYVRSEV